MKLSTHYYILSLSEHTTRLYEAFRDSVIDIQNTWFPFESSVHPSHPALGDSQLQTHLEAVDRHFGHYHQQEPLGVILAGTARHISAFSSVTAHRGVIIGRSEGDYSTKSPSELARLVWPLVKAAMAGAGNEANTHTHNVAVGIDSVGRSAHSGTGATLLVEVGYRVQPPANAPLDDDCDNAVDTVIDRVLAMGGNVLFSEDGSLSKFQRIALILPT